MDLLKTITVLFMYYYSVPGLEVTASHGLSVLVFIFVLWITPTLYLRKARLRENELLKATQLVREPRTELKMFICTWNNRKGDLCRPERGKLSGKKKKGCDFRRNFHTEASACLLIESSSWWIKNKITQKPLCQGMEVIGKDLIFFA